jgi:hypothetical protein
MEFVFFFIRKVQENLVRLKLNGTHQLLAYANVNLLEDNIDTIKENTKTKLNSMVSVVLKRLSGPRSRPTTLFLVVPGIEPGPPDLQPRTLTT